MNPTQSPCTKKCCNILRSVAFKKPMEGFLNPPTRPGHSPPKREEAVQEAAHVDRTATMTDLPAKVKTTFADADEQLDGKN